MSRGPIPQRARVWLVPVAVAALIIGTASAVVAKPSRPTAPGKPTSVSVEASSGELAVSWKKPSSGGTVGGYVATATPGGKSCTTTKLTCSIKGLVNGKEYTISVIAKGTGKADDSPAATAKGTPEAPALEISGSLATSAALTKANGTACTKWGIATKAKSGAPTPDCQLVAAAILPDGRIYTSALADAATSKNFSVLVRAGANEREDLTLHLLRADGAYIGPVVLGTKRTGNRTFGLMSLAGLATGKVTVPALTLSKVGNATAFASMKSGSVKTGSLTSRLCPGNVPVGAGRAGYRTSCGGSGIVGRLRVPAADGDLPASCNGWMNSGKVMPQTCFNDIKGLLAGMGQGAVQEFISACTGAIGKTQANAPQACATFLENPGGGQGDGDQGGGGDNDGGDPCAELASGGDLDEDGIPNAIDVDDNGNGTVDMADPETDGTCTVEPYKGIRMTIGSGRPLNYAVVAAGLATAQELSDDIDALFDRGEFSIAYYVYKTGFFPGALEVDGAMPAVWVTCPGVAWCDPALNPRTVLGTNVEEKNPQSVYADEAENNSQHRFQYAINEPFKTFLAETDSACEDPELPEGWRTPCWGEIDAPVTFGGPDASCNFMAYDPDFNPNVPAAARNFLWRSVCGEAGRQRVVFGGGIQPRLAAGSTQSIRSQVSALDVLRLNYLLPGGGVGSIATTIGTYPITAPMARAFGNGQGDSVAVDYSSESPLGAVGNAVMISSENRALSVQFNRPQREQFPGEAGTTGYHDLHGLNYGLQFELGDTQFGCGAGELRSNSGSSDPWMVDSAYTSAPDFEQADGGDDYANQLTPLRDTIADSPTKAPGVEQLIFTVDLVKCFQDRREWLVDAFSSLETNEWTFSMTDLNLPEGADVDGSATNWMDSQLGGNGSCIQASLVARGEAKTGGTDAANQQFCLQFAPGTLNNGVT